MPLARGSIEKNLRKKQNQIYNLENRETGKTEIEKVRDLKREREREKARYINVF